MSKKEGKQQFLSVNVNGNVGTTNRSDHYKMNGEDGDAGTPITGKYFYQKERSTYKSEHTDLSVARMKRWLPPALGAICCFFIGNASASVVTAEVNGLACLFYLSTGGIVCSLFNNLWSSYQHNKAGKGFWNP